MKTIAPLPVNVASLSYLETFCRFFIDHGHMFVGLLPVCRGKDEQNKREDKLSNILEAERSVVPQYDAYPVSMEKPKNHETT